MVHLVPMSDAYFAVWNPRTWASYHAELLRAGMSEQAADENIAQNVAATMPGGVLAKGQHLFEVRYEDATVGAVWLADRGGEWFIYDIEIDEAHQGRGLGRAAMRCIEEFVRERGGASIGLSVFGFNERAQHLYLSEGYEVQRLSMMKRLP